MFRGDAFQWRLSVLKATTSGLLRRARPVPRHCPICGYQGLFAPTGWPVRPEARCPRCGSYERHRLFKLWLDRNRDRLQGRRILHFAPEPSLTGALRATASAYTTADFIERADLKLDIEAMDLPDARFDVVICAHVLEHVDDAKALGEIFRILTDGGLALLMVPVSEGLPATYENASVTDSQTRELHFGQADHVRWFGPDFRTRVRRAGFALDEFTATGELAVAHGLYLGEKLFIATKPDAASPLPAGQRS